MASLLGLRSSLASEVEATFSSASGFGGVKLIPIPPPPEAPPPVPIPTPGAETAGGTDVEMDGEPGAMGVETGMTETVTVSKVVGRVVLGIEADVMDVEGVVREGRVAVGVEGADTEVMDTVEIDVTVIVTGGRLIFDRMELKSASICASGNAGTLLQICCAALPGLGAPGEGAGEPPCAGTEVGVGNDAGGVGACVIGPVGVRMDGDEEKLGKLRIEEAGMSGPPGIEG